MTLAKGANVQDFTGEDTNDKALIVSKYATRNKILARKDKLMRLH